MAAASLLGHVLVLDRMGEALSDLTLAPSMTRMEAVFTRVLKPSAPPRPGAAPSLRPPVRRFAVGAPAAASAASTPELPGRAASVAGAASEVDVSEPSAASAPASAVALEVAAAASVPEMQGPAVAASAASAVVESRLHWPRSTRLSYTLGGWYRGEVHGQASVEWLRRDDRYQIHLEVQVGPRIAPLISRRLSSEGTLSEAHGLRPRRFEQDTHQMFSHQRAQIAFDDQGVRLGNGPRLPAEEGLQDSASQFIQMMYLFTVNPEKTRPGTRLDFALALPSRVQRWSYRVDRMASVETPYGTVEALHVVPLTTSGRGVLSAEVWYAPSLQWLPVRMKMKQDDETWVDLLLARPPEQE